VEPSPPSHHGPLDWAVFSHGDLMTSPDLTSCGRGQVGLCNAAGCCRVGLQSPESAKFMYVFTLGLGIYLHWYEYMQNSLHAFTVCNYL